MTYNYLPPEELNDSKLNGIFKVSFEIKVESQDELSLSDVTQALTEGLERGFGEGFIDKVADLSVEKIKKNAQKVLKVGDKVYLKDSLKLKASIYEDDGYFFIGKPTSISNELGEQEIILEAGSMGYINRIDGAIIEIADVDRAVKADLGFDPEYEQLANVDLIAVKVDQIEKIDSEEVK